MTRSPSQTIVRALLRRAVLLISSAALVLAMLLIVAMAATQIRPLAYWYGSEELLQEGWNEYSAYVLLRGPFLGAEQDFRYISYRQARELEREVPAATSSGGGWERGIPMHRVSGPGVTSTRWSRGVPYVFGISEEQIVPHRFENGLPRATTRYLDWGASLLPVLLVSLVLACPALFQIVRGLRRRRGSVPAA